MSQQEPFDQESPLNGLIAGTRSEQQLRAAEQAYRHLVESSPFGIYVVDANFRVMVLSEGAQRVMGSLRPLAGRDLAEIMRSIWQEPFASSVIDIFRHTLKTGESYHALKAVEMRRDYVAVESYEWKVDRITLPNGQLGVVCHFYDLSERNRYEVELRAQEQRLRLATKTSAVGIWEWNLQTNVVRWDEEMFRIYGVTPTQGGLVQYSDWSGAVVPEELEENERILQKAIQDQGSSSRAFRIRRRNDGECRHIESTETVHINEKGEAEWVLGTNLDVTERHRAEEALRESDERYRGATAAVSDVIWTNDADGLMKGAQNGWSNFTGQSLEECQGYGWAQAVHPEDAPATIKEWNRAVAQKRTFVFEHRVRRHDGEWRICSVRAVPILHADGTIREWVGVHTDITERKRDEEKLRQLAAELSEAHHRKDEFLAMLAHELRNPLDPIRNGLQLMKLAEGQVAIVEEAHSMIERQLIQMVRLIDDLMDVTRINQGKLELRKERVQLELILSNAVETSRPLIEQMGHQLTVTLPKEPLIVNADITRLAQVFLNLLNNAAKYSDRGGHIRLTAARRGSEVTVSVQDTGIGIAADQLPRLFDMFAQVDRSLEKSQGGLGIGLTLAKRLAEMHGGRVEAHSEGPGHGSEFVVSLPLSTAGSQQQEVSGKEERSAPSSHRILVVDDNQDGANTLSMMLEFMGNEVRTAYDGQQGLDVAEQFQPDVVILDIGLPKLNGYEVCRRIREQPWGSGVVMIAVTGWGQDDDRRRSQEAGFDHHVIKPVDPKALTMMLAGIPGPKQ